MIATLDVLDAPSAPETTSETDAPRPRKRGGGPKTEEGKNIAHRNAMKHSLRARLVLPDELETAYHETRTAYFDELKPVGRVEQQLVSRMAFTSVQLERSAELAISDLRRVIDRAENFWDLDRQTQVDNLDKRLKKDPERIAHRLERYTQGADWLIDRWEGLADALRTNGRWDDTQRDLAFDLLGVSKALRDGHAKVPAPDDRNGLMTLVKDEIGRLWDEQRATLNRLDMHEQDLACCGMPVEADAETKRLRKYDSDLSREWRWAYDQLFKLRSDPSRLAKVEARLAKCPLPIDGVVSERVGESVAPSNTPVMIEDDADQLIWSDAEALARAMAELEAMEETDEEEAAEEETPVPAPVSAPPAPRPSVPSFVPSGAKGGNRRQRRAAEKRARQKARRSTR